jgi:synaptobrevin homolog YKT6
MRAYAGIGILKWNADNEATSLGMAVDVSNYGYFQRGPVKEMMAFVARTVAKRTHPGQRQSVQQVVTHLTNMCTTDSSASCREVTPVRPVL